MSHGAAPCLFVDNFRSYAVESNSATVQFFTDDADSNGPTLNRIFFITLIAENAGVLPTVTITYDGVAMTLDGTISQAGAGPRLTGWMYYMKEAALPATAGLKDLAITLTGGSAHSFVVGGGHFKNIDQTPGPVSVTTSDAFNNTISLLNTKASNEFFIGSWGSGLEISDFTYSNSQIEIFDLPNLGLRAASTYNNSDDFISTPWVADLNSSASKTVGIGTIWVSEPDLNVYFDSTVTVVSTVTADLLVPTEFSATVTVVATVDPNEFFYFRKFSTDVAVTSTVTSTLERSVTFDSTTTVASGTVIGQFLRAVDFTSEVVVVATPAGTFNATRPFSAQVDAVATVSAEFGSDFNETTTSLTPGCYIELFEIDTTVIGGGDIFRFVPHGYEGTNVFWQGEEFLRFPIEIDGFEWNATSQAPPQPTLTLSNVNKFVLAAVITLGDLVGAKVTRWRTYIQFLDGEPQADPNAHFPPDIFFIEQKTSHNKVQMEWTLASALDLQGDRLPKRQVLRDQTTGNLYAPGVANIRFRGR